MEHGVAVMVFHFRWQVGSVQTLCGRPLEGEHALAPLESPPEGERLCTVCGLLAMARMDAAQRTGVWPENLPPDSKPCLDGTHCEHWPKEKCCMCQRVPGEAN